jgi:D-glycero-D-manno-heptose 1,7-bisphosphate phosphatase
VKRAAVFLDRDGVINPMVYNPEFGIVDSPAHPGEFTLMPGVGQAIAELNRLGLPIVVVSNQPGIAKGHFTQALLEATTNKMLSSIREKGGIVDAVYQCLHHPDAVLGEYRIVCDCRKPKPGLLLRAARELDIDLTRSYMIGDGVTDVLAGRAAGTLAIFISSRKCYVCDELARQGVQPDYMVANLWEAAVLIKHIVQGDLSTVEQHPPACSAFRAIASSEKSI